ncbi:nitronate monooxygenase [Pseudooceanicola sp. 216_PA32_1]|uniref:Nitronate monooxygenase n=1 Tax=Pseudooceanicola pacificus TaxID=2676438 RepID=A0A844WCV2_9RHOB|nr:nitronate monooxygenase [Pseudooceanicola pacificus]MWB78898.1 nitronate monooxygenase [Pseudooceanicola pacificus]
MISTRLTDRFGLDHPVVSAPMARAGGGRLAAAVTAGGGLGLIGGGYCDRDWIRAELDAAGNAAVGMGFITWKLDQAPGLLEEVLERRPRAVFLSFGDPVPHAAAIAGAGVPLFAQVQSVEDARRAVAAGAAVIVAQGTEAGGHGAKRATLTLVPEVADYLAAAAPDTILLAAGGIADGRGLAAALMLGAEGVLCGTRFWATAESLVPEAQKRAALEADGDATLRGSVIDVARGIDWPARFDLRTMRNPFIDRWQGDLPGLAGNAAEKAAFARAADAGDIDTAPAIVGEGIGVIRDLPGAAEIPARLVAEAEALLTGGWRR